MGLFEVQFHHMFGMMKIVLPVNILCVGLALSVAREKQYKRRTSQAKSACGPFAGMCEQVRGQPTVFYILLFVQAVVWMGNTVWGTYGKLWFTGNVHQGDAEAPENSISRLDYEAGAADFVQAGSFGSVFGLVVCFALMALACTKIPQHFVYAPCIFVGSFVCFMCAFVVGHDRQMAIIMFVLSSLTLTAAGSIPYGIVALWNEAAMKTGKAGSVAMQMAILNCCITVGQQLCTVILSLFEGTGNSVPDSLRLLFMVSCGANAMGGVACLFLGRRGGKANAGPSANSSADDSSES